METAMDRTSDASREIVEALRRRVRLAAARHEDRVDERVSRYWIAWRSHNRDRVFAEIRPLRKRVEVFILPGLRDLRGGAGLARRAPRTQGWGWFRTRFDVRSMSEIEVATRLILQSYLHGVRGTRGNGRHAIRRRQGL
ncbi:MAG TPA: hypothetical protein VF992_03500 [Thermoplasmata archaeon]